MLVYYGGSGSSWLLNTIERARPVLVPAYEPLEPHHWDAPPGDKLRWLEAALTPADHRDPDAVAAWERRLAGSPQFRRLSQPRYSLVGFKMSVGAVGSYRRMLGLLVERRPLLLFLERENRLKHALSLYRSQEEGANQFGGGGERRPSRVELDAFDTWVHRAEAEHRALTGMRRDCAARSAALLRVAYEDFVTPAGKRRTVERVFSFLGIDPADARGESTYEKATPDDLRLAVENYDDFAARYRETGWARFLGPANGVEDGVAQ